MVIKSQQETGLYFAVLYFCLQLVQQQESEDEAEASQEEDRVNDDEVT